MGKHVDTPNAITRTKEQNAEDAVYSAFSSLWVPKHNLVCSDTHKPGTIFNRGDVYYSKGKHAAYSILAFCSSCGSTFRFRWS